MATRVLILVVLLSAAGVYARDLASQRVLSQTLPTLDQLPATFDGWYSEDSPLSESIAAVLDADVTLQRRYRHPNGAQVWLFLAYFAQQQVNSQIHSPRHCVPGGGWNVAALDRETVQLSQGPTAVARMLLERNGVEEEMLYWFRTRGGIVTGEYALKWDLMRNALGRKPTDALFIRYSASREHTTAMRGMVSRLDPLLNDILGEIGLE